MKRLSLILTTICLMLFFVFGSVADWTRVTNVLRRQGRVPSAVWAKYVGGKSQFSFLVPDIMDYSYAGYQRGEEGIPVVNDLTVVDVTDHGAVPNDGQSDTDAIRRVFANAQNNTIIYFPPGKYDVSKGNDNVSPIFLPPKSKHIIVRGAGGQGFQNGGTTIRIHNKGDLEYQAHFSTPDEVSIKGIRVTSNTSRGSTSFTVDNASRINFPTNKYIHLKLYSNEIYDDHVSVPLEDLPPNYTSIRAGMRLRETHEIERIDGNTVHIKTPLLTRLTPSFQVEVFGLSEFCGFEELHFDGGIDAPYVHGHYGRGGIHLRRAAHSWVKNCRFTSVDIGVALKDSYACSIIGVYTDGMSGHYPVLILGSTYCFAGLVEDNSTERAASPDGGYEGFIHGTTCGGKSAGSVFWGIGGDSMRGPDTHGDHVRSTLYDNMRSYTHESCSGAGDYLPHHLDGYVRWNNVVKSSEDIDYWTENSVGLRITQAILVGYDTDGGAQPANALVDQYGQVVTPTSLYVAQLERRMGHKPAWIDQSMRDFDEFKRRVERVRYSREDYPPYFSQGGSATFSVPEDFTASTISEETSATDVDSDRLSYWITGPDASSFIVHPSQGWLMKAVHLTFDYETKTSYSVVINVSDGTYKSTLSVTVNITDVEEVDLLSRSTAVRNAIADALNKDVDDNFTPEELESITSLTVRLPSSVGKLTVKVDDFSGLSGLKTLDLSDNRLTSLPLAVFTHTPELEVLNLHDNRFHVIDSHLFDSLTNLKELDLSDNSLSNVATRAFRKKSSLVRINLSNQHKINSAGSEVKTLTWLSADTFRGSRKIERLDLSDNGIRSLPIREVFFTLNNLKEVKLDGNPGAPFDIEFNVIENPDGEGYKVQCLHGSPVTTTIAIRMENTTSGSIQTKNIRFKSGYTIANQVISTERLQRNPGDIVIDITTFQGLPTGYTGINLVKASTVPLTIEDDDQVDGRAAGAPNHTALGKNFPNPFNPETWIPYQLVKPSKVSITIFNSRGVVVRELPLGIKSAGYYTDRDGAAYWDGKNNIGEPVSSGIYFYHFKSNTLSTVRRMVILK